MSSLRSGCASCTVVPDPQQPRDPGHYRQAHEDHESHPSRRDTSAPAATTTGTSSSTRASGSRKVWPERLIDAITSPWALRTGAASAVSPTSSSSAATAYPWLRTVSSSRSSSVRLVIVLCVYAG